jgi:hypothetical protein
MDISILAEDGSLEPNTGSNAISILAEDGSLMPNNGSNAISILDANGAFAPNSPGNTYSILLASGAMKPYEEGNTYSILDPHGAVATASGDVGLPGGGTPSLSSVTDVNGSDNVVAEDATVGTTVGITARAVHSGETVTYSLTDDAGGLFDIDSSTGVVTVAGALDYETASVHAITVQAASSDGVSTSSRLFTIFVTDVFDDVEEPPPEGAFSMNFSVGRNSMYQPFFLGL